jgi:hypothetical protein
MGTKNVARLLLGRVADPNNYKNAFLQELQDAIDELVKTDDMAFVKIHSANLGSGRIRAKWSKEASRIQVDHLSILPVVAATVVHSFSVCVVAQLLGPDNPASGTGCMESKDKTDRAAVSTGAYWQPLFSATLIPPELR